MAIRDVTFQSLTTADVRRELASLAPQATTSPPRLWIATDLFGPAWLNMVTLDLELLLREAKQLTRIQNQNRIMFRINRQLVAGQYLQWTVFTSYDIPKIAAWLQINNKTFKVGQKPGLKAKSLWTGSVEIHPTHLQP